MDNTLCCDYGEDAGCRFLDTGYLKVIIFFYPASSIQDPVSYTLWNKRSFSKFCLFWFRLVRISVFSGNLCCRAVHYFKFIWEKY